MERHTKRQTLDPTDHLKLGLALNCFYEERIITASPDIAFTDHEIVWDEWGESHFEGSALFLELNT